MKNLTILIFLVFMVFLSESEAVENCAKNENSLSQCWEKNLELYGSSSLPDGKQSFCYIKEDGTIGGINIDKPLVIASVSKIFTSLWAINRSQFGPKHQFKTKFYINGDQLHIEGGSDPVFARRSLYSIFDKLNQMGHVSFKTVTFDKNFYFTPQALDNTYFAQVYNKGDTHYCVPYAPKKTHTIDDLEYYFNSSNWESNLRIKSSADIPRGSSTCLNTKLTGESLSLDYQNKKKVFSFKTANIKMNAASVKQVKRNPLTIQGKVLPGTKVLEYKSQDLGDIIKFINVNSANQPSDLLFHILGGKDQFQKEFKTTMSESTDQKDFQFISGSGLSNKTLTKGQWSVESNKASCRSVLSILEFFLKYSNKIFDPLFDSRSEKFQTSAETRYQNITKMYMAVSGEEGTVRNRYRSEFARNFVAKTGTLGNGSSLVGTMKTKNGLRHFVMINNYTNSGYQKKANTAREIQKRTIKDLFQVLGKEEFSYSPSQNLRKSHFKPYKSIEVIND